MRIQYKTIEEELDALNNWFVDNPFVTLLEQIKEVSAPHFPQWEDEYGFVTNDLNALIQRMEYGFNGGKTILYAKLNRFLSNHDIITLTDGVVDVPQSNDPIIANLLIQLQDEAQK